MARGSRRAAPAATDGAAASLETAPEAPAAAPSDAPAEAPGGLTGAPEGTDAAGSQAPAPEALASPPEASTEPSMHALCRIICGPVELLPGDPIPADVLAAMKRSGHLERQHYAPAD